MTLFLHPLVQSKMLQLGLHPRTHLNQLVPMQQQLTNIALLDFGRQTGECRHLEPAEILDHGTGASNPPGSFWRDVGDGQIPVSGQDLETTPLFPLVRILVGPELLDEGFFVGIRGSGCG